MSLQDVDWRDARVRLSTERLLVHTDAGRKAVPLSSIVDIGDPFDGNEAVAEVAGYVGLFLEEQVLLVSPEDRDAFIFDLHTALLDGRFVRVRHPAVKGGVVTDVEWQDGRLAVPDRGLVVTTETGAQTTISLDDVGPILNSEQTVDGESRPVLKVIHDEDGTVLQTFLTGPVNRCRFIESFLAKGARENHPEIDLDELERAIVIALYSGISPFRIPTFVDESVQTVESTYERLVERDILAPVRRRLEVAVAPGGRILATEAMQDE